MKVSFVTIAFLFFSFKNTFGQYTVTGKCVNTSDTSLPNCIISVSNNEVTSFALSDFEGKFTLRLVDLVGIRDFLKISFKLIGYISIDTFFIINRHIDVGNIILKESYLVLDKVLVKSSPITVSGDTTSFAVKSFSTKLDNNLEDVLSKMPGFSLSNSGEISFNGRPIESILVEGEELTKNYKQISKNITPDLLEKVQVIDKYNSNPVLKGLSNTQNQVLNLTLKNPKKLAVFGTVKAGVGVENKFEAAANLFVLKSKLKSLLIGSKNNTGESPYNEIVSAGRDAVVRDYDFDLTLVPDLIQKDLLFTRPLFSNASNTLFNKSNLAIVNNNIRINNKLQLKFFSDLYIDYINQFRNTEVLNLIDTSNSYKEEIRKTFKPFFLNNFAQFSYTTSKSRLLIAGSFIHKEYGENQSLLLRTPIYNKVENLYTRYSVGAFYTYRIDSSKAIELLYQNNNDFIDAKLFSAQDSSRLLDFGYQTNQQLQNLNQGIDFKKSTIKYIYKEKNGTLHKLILQNTNINSHLDSDLSLKLANGSSLSPSIYYNKSFLKTKEYLLNYNASFSIGRVNITTELGVSSFRQTIKQSLVANYSNINQFNLISNIRLSYNLKQLHFFSIYSGYDNELASFAQQVTNPILSNYRTLSGTSNNSGKINALKTTASYSYRNFNKGANFLLLWYHQSRFRGLIADNIYSKDFDYLQNFYSPNTQTLDNISLNADKYLEKLKLGFNFKNNITLFSNPVVAAGIVADRKYLAINSSIAIRPSVGTDINTSVGAELSYNKDLNARTAAYTFNPFFAIAYSFSDQISASTKFNFYNTNFFDRRQNYFFGSAFISYNLFKKKADLRMNISNFTNTNTVYSGFNTVFQLRSTETKILPRYATLQIIYHIK